jgi:hypothetical protein
MMHEFQLTRVALIGARIAAFHPYGFHSRNELALRTVAPEIPGRSLADMSTEQLQAMFSKQLPVWIHNILSDPDFPQRDKLLMPLRRFEGELHDSREDEVVSAVISAGFRDHDLNPLALPQSMPMRQRCAMLMQIEVWREAYQRLEQELARIMAACAPEVDSWLDSARETSHAMID